MTKIFDLVQVPTVRGADRDPAGGIQGGAGLRAPGPQLARGQSQARDRGRGPSDDPHQHG